MKSTALRTITLTLAALSFALCSCTTTQAARGLSTSATPHGLAALASIDDSSESPQHPWDQVPSD